MPAQDKTQSPSSFMLNFPSELRLQIYDAVVDLSLDCRVARRERKAFTMQPTPNRDTISASLSIPWLNLALVCKTIANELQHHVQTSGNTAYQLEIDNLESQYSIAQTVTWLRIPCPPSNASVLQADLVFDLKTRFWGAGGPNPILSELYQVLNCFIHNGPLLVRRSPLAKHIHLDTLILQIRVIEPDPEEQRAKGRAPYSQATIMELEKWLCGDLKRYIALVVDRGLLFGAVDKILCRWPDQSEATEWEVSLQPIGDMTEWNTYDFAWGVPGSSSLLELNQSQSDVTAQD
ncbi:hypothetical protein MSAN_01549800 [Mycena sanguinolenta]|uniref:Uncharacterized protein n=1 Tax=Mycena sanguinolenta TaxID=230812 RepID=A0A8H6Y0U6_9AGAR|nr:hypothetical protein MSAN_01549800 [Mycena sanguinolenta]